MFEKFTRDIAIDFGTASVLVYVQDQGIVLKEPSVVAIDVSTDRVVKVGQDAMEMLLAQGYCPPDAQEKFRELTGRLANTVALWHMECNKNPEAAEVAHWAMSKV